jgi:SAM-dependent methyltransferase
MDIHQSNLDTCRERLAAAANVFYALNNGFDFRPIADGSITAIYCYDAMVHFSPDLVASYLRDTTRVLAPGGRALYHHSNYSAPLERPYGQNPHARNHMTKALFAELSRQAGLDVLRSEPMDWGHEKNLDCLTLLERPRSGR